MEPLRVVVTGGSGRVGRHVVQALAARGHAVVNADLKPPAEAIYPYTAVDLGDRAQLEPLLREADAICHLGEIPGVYGGRPEDIYATNTRIGATVLQTAADLRLRRVIYTSTCQVYGTWGPPGLAPLRLPIGESAPRRPQNTYALCKAANEEYAEILARHAGLSVAIFRFPWIMQPEDVERSLEKAEAPAGPGGEMSTYVYAADAAEAFALALELIRPGCEAYHFSAREVSCAAPLAGRLARFHPDYPKLPENWPPFASPLDCAKARAHLGWEAQWNLFDEFRKRHGREPHAELKPAS